MQAPGPVTNGIRGPEFKAFIASLLKKGRVKQKYVDYLLDDDSMDLYAKAFTNPTADPANNYEILEKIGDATCNKAIMWYIFRKFPKLESKPQGLMIFSRLFHTLQSTKTFSNIGLNLGFEKFISSGWMRVKDKYEDVMKVKRNGVLEDCFEAFFGATELIIDKKTKEGVGYAICNEIFKGMISEMPFPSIKYEDLFDPITRLKELFDYNFPSRGRLGKYEYISPTGSDDDEESNKLKSIDVYWTNSQGMRVKIAYGSGSLKEKAKAVAAEHALGFFKARGYEKAAPYDHRDFI
jgi:dsRNA-specific ribonuclease